ncbi:MAG: hypothetical protein KF850_33100 [Labilithrix sp.]|nr:hypothetical protein [Labilithrix sp.]MBX3216917.1 hypothetical protein [Labilithrix sp.]
MMFVGLRPGDEVFVQQHRGSARWKVTKVGRKYFTAGGSEFLLEDGTSKSGYSYPRASTLAAHEKSVRVGEARAFLTAFGVKLDHFTKDDMVLFVFDAVKARLDAAPPSSKTTGEKTDERLRRG